ncbi:MAG: formyltransferase family protein [Bdellovibrionota bacterium]
MKISQAHGSFENSRVAVFVSGRGSNLQAILNQPEIFYPVLVVSNRKNAPALIKAKRAGIPVLIFNSQMTWEELSTELKLRRVNLIYLLGFMKIIPEFFCQQWHGRMINIHPSLLPLHPGLDGFEKSFENKNSLGVTIHEVIPEMDAGPILFQHTFRSTTQENKNELEFEKERLALALTEHRLVRESGQRCL